MSNFELINNLLNLGIDFKITGKSDYPAMDDWTLYVSDSHKLYPDECGQPCFWYVNHEGHDALWYCNDDTITIEIGDYY